MTAARKLTYAFIGGGVFGVIGQALLAIYMHLLGPNSPLLIAFLLISFGLIGGVLFVVGIYQKFEAILGFGAILPFSGLAAGVAGIIVHARMTGQTIGYAIKSGLKLLIFVVGIGMITSILIYLIVSFIGQI